MKAQTNQPTAQPTQKSTSQTARPNRSKKQNQNKNGRPNTKRPARAVREYSAGGLVYRIMPDNGVEFLLIEDLKGRWSVPKGHVESGETLEQTAVREISEETGLKNIQIVEKLDKVHFFYRFEGRLIFMTAFHFLVEAIDPDEPVVVEVSEGIVGARWFPAAIAEEVLEYKTLKEFLQRSMPIIDAIMKKKQASQALQEETL